MAGFGKGILPMWGKEIIYSTLRLGTYEPVKKYLGGTDPLSTPFYIKFLSGGIAGLVGSAFSSPADVIKVRMQASEGKPSSITWHINDIYTNWGLRGF